MLKRAHAPVDFEQEALAFKRRRCWNGENTGSPFKEKHHSFHNENLVNYSSPQTGQKRCRTSTSSCREEVLYTQRDINLLQEQQQTEMTKLKEELRRYQQEHDAKVQTAQQQNQVLVDTLKETHAEKEKLANENKILKNAVMTLNNKREEQAKQQHAAIQAIEMLQNKVKQLEQNNFALGMHLQQATCRQDGNSWDSGHSGGDIF